MVRKTLVLRPRCLLPLGWLSLLWCGWCSRGVLLTTFCYRIGRTRVSALALTTQPCFISRSISNAKPNVAGLPKKMNSKRCQTAKRSLKSSPREQKLGRVATQQTWPQKPHTPARPKNSAPPTQPCDGHGPVATAVRRKRQRRSTTAGRTGSSVFFFCIPPSRGESFSPSKGYDRPSIQWR